MTSVRDAVVLGLLFTANCHKRIFGDHHNARLAVLGKIEGEFGQFAVKRFPTCHKEKKKLKIYIIISQKCIYDILKSVLEIRILLWQEPDLFGHFRIPQRALTVRDLIFQPRSQIGIRVKAKSAGSKYPVFISGLLNGP
jgi:hypothetical protein